MTKRIPLEWVNRARLRLPLVGGLVALHDDDGMIPRERYAMLEEAGEIALMAEPKGEVSAEVEAEPEFPAYGSDDE